MTLVSTVTVGSGGAASIDFNSIAQTGTDLLVQFSGRGNFAAVGEAVVITFNGSSTGYSWRNLYGNGSSAASGSGSSTSLQLIMGMNGTSATSNTFSNVSIYIPNYAGSTNKSISYDGVHENNASQAGQAIVAGLWANTAAITSIALSFFGFDFLQNSTASLYLITKGSGGATTSP
jgi:hypothetical protein